MSAKKNAINISIGMILLSLIIIALCWHGRNEGATELPSVRYSSCILASRSTKINLDDWLSIPGISPSCKLRKAGSWQQ